MIFVDVAVDRYDEEGNPSPSSVRIGFPSTIGEISLRSWALFQDTLAHLPEQIQTLLTAKSEDRTELTEDWTAMDWANYYQSVAQLIAAFSDKSMEEILSLPLSAFDEQFGGGLLAVFYNIIGLLGEYEPKERKAFKYKGHTYIIPQSVVDNFGTATPGLNLTTIEAVQALQSEHVLSQTDEEGNFVIENHRYHVDVAILAALARRRKKNGTLEVMPYGVRESEMFIQKRMKLFEGISMDIARDVYFFLANSKRRSLTTHLSRSVSMLRQEVLNRLSK